MLSLVPIAFVYEVAHYFSLFLIQGQYVPAALGPFAARLGPDGLADYVRTKLRSAQRRSGTSRRGARRRARSRAGDRPRPRGTIFEDGTAALRSQYAMLALMVLYTGGRAVAALARLMLAHGGVYGAIAEAGLALGLAGLFVWIWLRRATARRVARGARSRATTADQEGAAKPP